jgi:Flp pilus assembly CpaF family ATPase
LNSLNEMDSDKILRVGNRLVSFLEASLDKGKPLCDNRIHNKISFYINSLASDYETKKIRELRDNYLNYLIRRTNEDR